MCVCVCVRVCVYVSVGVCVCVCVIKLTLFTVPSFRSHGLRPIFLALRRATFQGYIKDIKEEYKSKCCDVV